LSAHNDEEKLLRSVALQNAAAILLARQRAEEALEHSLGVLRATLESTTDGIVVTDNQGNITDCNEKYLTLWQIPAELRDTGSHFAIIEAIANRFAKPDEFSQRVREIYSQEPLETSMCWRCWMAACSSGFRPSCA
jgi:PAS domain-containing protein